MPLALVSDIHGNDDVLAAVVTELERLGIEQVVCLGDVAQGGDQPAQVLDRLAALGWPVILGNAEAFLLEVPVDSSEPITEVRPRHPRSGRVPKSGVAERVVRRPKAWLR